MAIPKPISLQDAENAVNPNAVPSSPSSTTQTEFPKFVPTAVQQTLTQKIASIAKSAGKSLVQPFAETAISVGNAAQGITKGVKDIAESGVGTKGLLEGKGEDQAKQDLLAANKPRSILGAEFNPAIPNAAIDSASSAKEEALGLTKVAGVGAQLGSTIAAPGELSELDGAGVAAKALSGAKVGAAIGGTGSLGSGLENGENAKDLVKTTALGAGTGAVLGSITGALPAWFKSLRSNTVEVAKAQSALDDTVSARQAGAKDAVDAYNSMVEDVSGHKSSLGTQFEQGAKDLTEANPDVKLNLTTAQIQDLNDIRETKNFALPKSLSGNFTSTGLNPSETQDLITQLNKATFQRGSDGSLAADQRIVGLTNDIKSQAASSFGPKWSEIYSNYSKGINAVQKLDDVVNLDKSASASDQNKALKTIMNLSKTPEGKIQLQAALEDYKNISGIDLSDPTATIQKVKDLEDSQKAATGVLKSAQRPLIQRHPQVGQISRIVERAAIGSGLLYPAIRAIEKGSKN